VKTTGFRGLNSIFAFAGLKIVNSSAEAATESISPDHRREVAVLLGLALALLAAMLLSLVFGRFSIPLTTVLDVARHHLTGFPLEPEQVQAGVVITSVRLPRICLAVLVGAALSVSGAAYQGLFRNPMVSPDVLGVSSGAGAGASLAILWGWPSLGIQALAFAFGLGAVTMVMFVARVVGRGGGNSILILILAGIVISALFSALGSLVKYLGASDTQLMEMVLWLLGSLARTGAWSSVLIVLAALIVGALPLYLLRWKINAMSFGEEEARALGVNVGRLRLIIIICATLLTASAVSLCGLIGWVGLIIPHLSRFLVGPNHRILLPTAMLGGGLFMLIADNFARVIVRGELPIGILTAFIGAPLFIYILCRSRKDWA
jgi:ABC-type Fe3+-siderophore transport system, permease component